MDFNKAVGSLFMSCGDFFLIGFFFYRDLIFTSSLCWKKERLGYLKDCVDSCYRKNVRASSPNILSFDNKCV